MKYIEKKIGIAKFVMENNVDSFSSYGLPFSKSKFYTKYDNAVPAEILNLLEPESESFNKIVEYGKTRGTELFGKLDGSDDPATDPLR